MASARSRAAPRWTPASAPCSTCLACVWRGPSFMRTSCAKICPAGAPANAAGTGSASGRTRHDACVSTATTDGALAAIHKPS